MSRRSKQKKIDPMDVIEELPEEEEVEESKSKCFDHLFSLSVIAYFLYLCS